MAKNVLDHANLNVTCPKCGEQTKRKIGLLRAKPEITCAGCGKVINIDTKSLAAGLERANKSLAVFKKNLPPLQKRK